MRSTWTFHSAGKLLFGRGAVRQLGDVVHRMGVKRVYVVTDPLLVKAGVLDIVRSPLAAAGLTVEVFAGGEPEPSLRVAGECAAAARQFRPDVVIGVGGGSNMDLAKSVGTVLTHGGTAREWIGDDKIPGPITPVICVPTTAGTGSEVSAAFVLTDTDNELKVGCLSNYLRPAAALVDPLLTRSCPPHVTAHSGMDALTHAIEAFTAVDNELFSLPAGERSVYQGRHAFGDMTAEKAILLIGRYLRRAVRDGNDLEAREGMALAATLAGLAFSNVGVAAVHALEYPVGGATHCSHGCGNALLLPYVMRYNLPVRKKALAQVAGWLGQDVAGLDEEAAAAKAIEAVISLRADVGIPDRLRELGVRESQLRGFAEKAGGIRRILRVNPREASVDDLEGILRSAL